MGMSSERSNRAASGPSSWSGCASQGYPCPASCLRRRWKLANVIRIDLVGRAPRPAADAPVGLRPSKAGEPALQGIRRDIEMLLVALVFTSVFIVAALLIAASG